MRGGKPLEQHNRLRLASIMGQRIASSMRRQDGQRHMSAISTGQDSCNSRWSYNKKQGQAWGSLPALQMRQAGLLPLSTRRWWMEACIVSRRVLQLSMCRLNALHCMAYLSQQAKSFSSSLLQVCLLLQGSAADDASQASSLLAHQQVYTLSAHLRSSPAPGSEAACRVRYIAMGSHVVVWAATPSMGVRSMTLAADAVGGSAAQAGQQAALLSSAAARRVHDELLLPVIQGLCSDEGLSPPTSLRTLPLEIKLLVLRNLPVRLRVPLPLHARNVGCTQGIQAVPLKRCTVNGYCPDLYIAGYSS